MIQCTPFPCLYQKLTYVIHLPVAAMHAYVYTYTVQLNYNFTIPRVNLHGSLQYHGWLLLSGIRVPRLFVYFA